MPDFVRSYDVSGLTTDELERVRRELAASLALARPGSPACVPITAQIRAIDTELGQLYRAGRETAHLTSQVPSTTPPGAPRKGGTT